MTAALDDRAVTTVGWLSRLPLLGAYELAMILDEDERASSRVLSDLLHYVWLEAGVASSPEIEPDRLYALSPAGRSEIARALALSPAGLGQELPVDPPEIAYRWARVEATVGLNRFLAELVVAVQKATNLQVETIRSLPRRRPRPAWWPAEVEAYGCLRANESLAPYFVAWDRAAAPFHHRQKRLSAWYAFSKEQQAWGNDVPPILILCANASTSAQWAKAARASGERHADHPLPIFLTEIDAAFSANPLDEIWRSPETDLQAALTERLTWRERVPDECRLRPLAHLPQTPSQQVPMRPVLTATDTSKRPASKLYRQIGVMEKRFLDWLAFHPLLTAEDLSVLVHCRRQQAQIVLARLKDAALIDGVVTRASDDACDDSYYFLSSEGLKTLALRDGVPARRYARYSPIAAAVTGWQGEGRLQTLLRQFDHTVGVNRFCVRVVADAPSCGFQVVQWLSASDAAVRFSFGELGLWLRPDSILDVHKEHLTRRFFIEWDRGTERSRQLREKALAYVRYFSTLSRSGLAGDRLPRLLVVTTSPSREKLIWEILQSAFEETSQPLTNCSTSMVPLVQRLGGLGKVWQNTMAARRQSLMGHDD